jgi:hypothetical protein
MRAESWGDVITYALKGAAIGAAGLGLCVPFAVWMDKVPWYAPFVIAPAVGGAGILVSIFKPKEQLLAKVEEWLDRDLDGDGRIGRVHYVVDGRLQDERGNEHYLKFVLESENGNVKWHNFCRAVLYGKPRANFSETEAKRQGLGGDWGTISRTFTAQHWMVPAKRRGTPRLKGLGWQWVKHYADNPPTPAGEALTFERQG